jgi:hypothetical protein
LTYHAEIQRRERKIELDEIRQTLRAPERARESRDDCFIFTKHVNDRRIKVVFSFRGHRGDAVIVTVGDEAPRDSERRDIGVSDGVLACAALSTRGERGEARTFGFDDDDAENEPLPGYTGPASTLAHTGA